METVCGGTESPKEHFIRSTRRIRNSNNNKTNINKNSAIKMNEQIKDQENVNNITAVQDEANICYKDEVQNSNTILDCKIETNSLNVNSSTPRRRKDPLANLHSNLSPKYIGFTTSSHKLDSSMEERTRNSSRRHNNSNVIDTSLDRDKEADISFASSFMAINESTVGYVRRTPINTGSQSTPDNSTRRKEFVSPIDKLLIKNGAIMDCNLSLEEFDELYKRDIVRSDKITQNKNDNSVTECEKIESDFKESNNFEEGIDQKQFIERNVFSPKNTPQDNEGNKIDDGHNQSELEDIQSNKDDEVTSGIMETELQTYKSIETDEHGRENCEMTSQTTESENSLQPQFPSVEESLRKDDELFSVEDARSDVNDNDNLKLTSPTNESMIESPDVVEQIETMQVKIELESAETESNNEYAVDAATLVNSPSAVSMDSAKGSSIINEGSWVSFSTGDLYWGQIYNYCYWPCMVCPDPDGKTITTEEVGRTGDQHILVHVRFFADNGRRNWVKRENLLTYAGIENYQERIEEVRQKYGAKSAKYKLYVPPKRKEAVWNDAVNEANMVAEVAYADRLQKFFDIFEKSRAFHKLDKRRRKSMYISVNHVSTSDMDSPYSSSDIVNNLSVPVMLKHKRERSISPYSPAYSPIKPIGAKRRKLSVEHESASTTSQAELGTWYSTLVKSEPYNSSNTGELNLSQTNSVTSNGSTVLSDLDIFNGLDFKKFYSVMKDFVMEQNRNENLEKSLIVAVRNIWALKQLSRHQMERKLQESPTETGMISTAEVFNDRQNGEGSVVRLSSRLKSLMARKSLMSQQTPETTPERSMTPKLGIRKSRKRINRPILEVINDIFELDSKYLFKGMSRDPVCKYCYKPGDNLKRCAKNCSYWLHQECLHKNFDENGKVRRGPRSLNSIKNKIDILDGGTSAVITNIAEVNTLNDVTEDLESAVTEVICKECANNEPTKCMVCKCTESKKDDDPLVKCTMTQCDRAFHPACCKYWPQSKITISNNQIESFRCPSHVCHTCVSDDPKGKFQHLSNTKLTKCVKCPATFHTDSTCIPAGSQILTAAHIICPRHTSMKHDMTVNVNWCFICVSGGQVMCCETCPTAVHAHCLNIPVAANEGYICEECESGRMPLYGEMVWAKFNNFRWWPAIILPPTEIPQNILRKPHNPSDFVVRFFGTHDHGWISRRRVYLYLEGDSSEPPKTKSNLDLSYNRGIEEAKQVYEVIKMKKIEQRNSNENKEKLHPQPYVRIKANRPVPPVRLHINIESVNKCECDPNDVNPCGPDTNCLNRVLYHECNPKLCPAAERCQNQMFESRISPRLDVVYMKERGFGLVCREPIKAGTFVIEYVGEIINDNEFQARMRQKSRDRDENFYFLSVEKDYIIDAGPKGNLARFMNHSCDPNCETQKWLVNSLNRVGLFAIKDIPENTELTFNYHWDELLGNEKKTCFCGSKKCAGQIGAKLRHLETIKEPPVSGTSRNKSKLKNKPLKRLRRRGRRTNLGTKVKLNGKTRTKKLAVSTSLDAKDNLPNEESVEANEKAFNSKRLESPDVFS